MFEDDVQDEPLPPRAMSPMGLVSFSGTEDIAEKEQMQKKHYFYLSQLQGMAKELPGKFQQRLPYDLLTSLANALLDGTVMDIVMSLKEVQQLEEKALSNQRLRLISEQKAQKQEMLMKHRNIVQQNQIRPHQMQFINQQNKQELEVFELRSEDEKKKKDMKIILELDQKVMDQQSTLEKAGVPGFTVTNNTQEMRLQMYLLDFIIRLSQMDYTKS